MKIKIIQLLCLLVILGCQKNDIEVFNGANTNLANLNGNNDHDEITGTDCAIYNSSRLLILGQLSKQLIDTVSSELI